MFSQILRSVRRVPRVRKRKPGLGPFNVVLEPKVLKMLWWFEKSPRPKNGLKFYVKVHELF